MKDNYSKQQGIRERKRIVSSELSNTAKTRLIRNLDTIIQYETLGDSCDSKATPDGILLKRIDGDTLGKKILQQALQEVDIICGDIETSLGEDTSDKVSNLRFAINTPYFSRNSEDPFPLFRWNDPRVAKLCECVSKALEQFNLEFNPMLNIIIRRYRPGDTIKFHSDRSDFGENIFGLILQNEDPDRGLLLFNPNDKKSKPYMLEESPGLTWMLTGSSRWEYEHGYATYFKEKHSSIRTSVTFRFFQKELSIPKKSYE
jgi:alkylated DNA repair dioxygenase AlkB